MTDPTWRDPATTQLAEQVAALETLTARHQDTLDLLAALNDFPGRHTQQTYRARATDGIMRTIRAGDVRGILATGRQVEVSTTLTTDWHPLDLAWGTETKVA